MCDKITASGNVVKKSFFKVRQVEQFEASSSPDSTADVNHMINYKRKTQM